MNSFRIGVIGVMVNYWGQADGRGLSARLRGLGRVHGLPGGAVCWRSGCSTCCRLDRRSLWDRIDLSSPTLAAGRSGLGRAARRAAGINRPFWLLWWCCCWPCPSATWCRAGPRTPPARETFTAFPLIHQGWMGRETRAGGAGAGDAQAHRLHHGRVSPRGGGMPVSFYVAYYASRSARGRPSTRPLLPAGRRLGDQGFQPSSSGRRPNVSDARALKV